MDPEYIAYDILDSNPDNLTSDTVESLYQKIEEWIEESKVILQYDKLKGQEVEYDKVYVYFDNNFEERLTNITQVVDKDHPLQKQEPLIFGTASLASLE